MADDRFHVYDTTLRDGAQQEGLTSADIRSREPFLASLAGFVLLAAIVCVLHKTYDTRPLDALLDPIRQAAQAETADEVRRVMGAKEDSRVLDLEKIEKHFPDQVDLMRSLEPLLAKKDMAAVHAKCREILDKCHMSLLSRGSLTPDKKLPLSKLSGAPASDPLPVGPDGRIPERLPAANVAGLGRSLFTDYLVPVQLAAVLLLVATIGAIAIAGRRPEGLR